jgi:hypothetical protein
MSRRPFRPILLALFLVGALTVALGASGGIASSQHKATPADEISDCLATLNKYKYEVRYTNDLLSRKGQNATLMLLSRNGLRTFVSVRQFTDSLTLQYLSGGLTFAEYKGGLLALRRALVSTRQWLQRARESLGYLIGETQKRCDALRQKPKPTPPKPKPPAPPPGAGSWKLVQTENCTSPKKVVGLACWDPEGRTDWQVSGSKATRSVPGDAGWDITYEYTIPATLPPAGDQATLAVTVTDRDPAGVGGQVCISSEFATSTDNCARATAPKGQTGSGSKDVTLKPSRASSGSKSGLIVALGDGGRLYFTYEAA